MVIYAITCTKNGRLYIGQTIRKFSERKGLHLFHLRRGIHPNPHLQAAFNKYGEGNFSFSIIARCTSLEELNSREHELILQYNTLDRTVGFNIRVGGLNYSITDEHKEGIRKALLGNTNGAGNKGKVKPNNRNGIPVPQAVRDKISATLKGRPNPLVAIACKARERPVEQLTLEGEIIAEFPTIKKASLATGANRSTLNLCCQGKKRTAGGFKWKYKMFPNENHTK